MEGCFRSHYKKILDNPLSSVKVAQEHQERTFSGEIVPNPFGGVNTHLWRNEAYIVGIVPVVRPAYSPQTRNGKGAGGKIGRASCRERV